MPHRSRARRWAAVAAAAGLVLATSGCDTDQALALTCTGDYVGPGVQRVQTTADTSVGSGFPTSLVVTPLPLGDPSPDGALAAASFEHASLTLRISSATAHFLPEVTFSGGDVEARVASNDGETILVRFSPRTGARPTVAEVALPRILLRAQTHGGRGGQKVHWYHQSTEVRGTTAGRAGVHCVTPTGTPLFPLNATDLVRVIN